MIFDDDYELELEVVFDEEPSKDPCITCNEKYACANECSEKMYFDMEQNQIDWDDKPSRQIPRY